MSIDLSKMTIDEIQADPIARTMCALGVSEIEARFDPRGLLDRLLARRAAAAG